MDHFLNLLGENSQEDKSTEEFMRQMQESMGLPFSATQDSEGLNSFGINQAAFGHAGLSFDMTEGGLVNSGELYDLRQEIRSLGVHLINAKLLPEEQIKIRIERLNPSLAIFAGNDEWVTLSREDSLHYLLCQLCSKSFSSTSEQEVQKRIINDILAKGVNINYTGNKALNEDLKETYSEYGPSFEDIREVVTPLSKAAKNHDIDLMLYLLEQGAEVTPATLRTISCSPHLKQAGEVVMYLVSEGVDINKADDKGTILHGMRGTGVEAEKFVLLMLESGVDPCKQDAKGYSALHVAVENMRYKASWMMIEYGANPYTEAHDGKSAIDLAQNQTQRKGLEFNYQRQQENPDFKKICQEVEDEEEFDLKSTINETIENITQINESLFGGSRQAKRQVNPYDINSVFAAVDELIAASKDVQPSDNKLPNIPPNSGITSFEKQSGVLSEENELLYRGYNTCVAQELLKNNQLSEEMPPLEEDIALSIRRQIEDELPQLSQQEQDTITAQGLFLYKKCQKHPERTPAIQLANAGAIRTGITALSAVVRALISYNYGNDDKPVSRIILGDSDFKNYEELHEKHNSSFASVYQSLDDDSKNFTSTLTADNGQDDDTGICKVSTIYSEDDFNAKKVSAKQRARLEGVKIYGINPHQAEPKDGILKINTELPGGELAARECFKNLTGVEPPMEILEGGYFPFTKPNGEVVVIRLLGKSGHAKVEINAATTTKTHEKITFLD